MEKLNGIVKCPYCGTETNIDSDKQFEEKVILCDSDKGGCEEYFAVFTSAKLTSKVYKIEITEEKDD